MTDPGGAAAQMRRLMERINQNRQILEALADAADADADAIANATEQLTMLLEGVVTEEEVVLRSGDGRVIRHFRKNAFGELLANSLGRAHGNVVADAAAVSIQRTKLKLPNEDDSAASIVPMIVPITDSGPITEGGHTFTFGEKGDMLARDICGVCGNMRKHHAEPAWREPREVDYSVTPTAADVPTLVSRRPLFLPPPPEVPDDPPITFLLDEDNDWLAAHRRAVDITPPPIDAARPFPWLGFSLAVFAGLLWTAVLILELVA